MCSLTVTPKQMTFHKVSKTLLEFGMYEFGMHAELKSKCKKTSSSGFAPNSLS